MPRTIGAKDRRPRKTAARKMADAAAAEGITPLDVMLRTMRETWAKAEASDDDRERLALQQTACGVAEKAAPYVHARLSATEHSGAIGLSHEEALAQLDAGSDDEPAGAETTH